MAEKAIAVIRPSRWEFFGHYFFFFLLIPPFVAWLKRRNTVLRVYEDRVSTEVGIFSKHHKELAVGDIRTVEVHQGLWNRIFRIGTLMIASSGTDVHEIVMTGVPRPNDVKNLIMLKRRGAIAA